MKFPVFALILSFFSIGQLHASEPFLWVDDEDYEPYIYKAEGRQIKGLYKDLMVEIFSRMEIPLKYAVYPWKRTQMLLKYGEADAMISIPSPKRLVFLSPTDPVIHLTFRVFARSDNPKIKQIMAISSIKELEGFNIIDYIGNGWAEKNFKGLNVQKAPGFTNAILMLAGKRGDVFVDDSIVVKYAIKKLIKNPLNPILGLKTIVSSPHPLEVIPYSLLIRKDSKYLWIIPKFNEALEEIRSDGTYDKILNKFIEY